MPANKSGGPRGLRHWSQFIIRSSPTGVITLDYQGRINDINPAAGLGTPDHGVLLGDDSRVDKQRDFWQHAYI